MYYKISKYVINRLPTVGKNNVFCKLSLAVNNNGNLLRLATIFVLESSQESLELIEITF